MLAQMDPAEFDERHAAWIIRNENASLEATIVNCFQAFAAGFGGKKVEDEDVVSADDMGPRFKFEKQSRKKAPWMSQEAMEATLRSMAQ